MIDRDVRNILCIRYDARGDILLTTPAVRALRKRHVNAKIHYLAKRDSSGVLVNNPDIDRVFILENPRGLNAIKYDLAIDWNDRETRVIWKAKRTVRAIDDPSMRSDLASRKLRHEKGLTFAQLYARVAGVELSDGARNVLDIPESAKISAGAIMKRNGLVSGQFITASFDSCWQTKCYPLPLLKQLIAKIATPGIPIVLIGSYYRHNLKLPNIVNLVGKTSIMEAAAIIGQSRLFIGIDSLPLHLADTLGIESVSIWTATHPDTILTDGSKNRSVVTSKNCNPCWREKCSAVKFPTPDEIAGAVKDVIGITEPQDKITRTGAEKVYIVIPSYTETALLVQAVNSIFHKTNRRLIDFHITIVDDGGNNEHRKACDKLNAIYGDDVDVIHRDNGGFVEAVNAGISHVLTTYNPTDDDYILWLNDDVIVKNANWLRTMADASAKNAVVGPQGSLLHDNFNHGGYLSASVGREPHYIDGWCLFAPARYYRTNSIGILDERISEINPFGAFSEDADWCIRARQHGVKLKIVNVPGLKHLHHKTFKNLGKHDAHIPSLRYMREKYGTLKNALRGRVSQEKCKRIIIEPNISLDGQVKISCCFCGDKAEDVILGEKRGLKIVKCQRCGIQRFAETVSDEETMRIYNDSINVRTRPKWIAGAKRTQSEYWRQFDEYDIQFMERRGRWLDVGCNLGYLLEMAKKNSWDAVGVEISPVFVKQCREKGLNVILGRGISDKVTGKFNMITLLDVIEHDPDPIRMLRRAHELLNPDGILAVSTPDHASPIARKHGLNWDHVRPIEHLWHFTTATTCRLLEETGFAMDKMVVTDSWNYPGARLYICRRIAL